jgi:hypothetical protein
MTRLSLRVFTLFVVLVLGAGCGKDDGGSSNPAAPGNTGNTSSNPPPSGVALISGNWTGTSDFQQNGVHSVSNVTATVTQSDRNVQGNIRFTSPAFDGWFASFNGQLAGTASDTQFVGNVTLTTPTSTGTSTCTGQTVMSGRSINTVMRWEAMSMTLVPTTAGAPQSICRGEIFTLVWIFGR